MRNKHRNIEEPCDGKLSSTVLKTSGIGDSLAEFNQTEAMADWWIDRRLEFLKEAGTEISFVLRNPDDDLIGSFGVDDFKLGTSQRVEIG
jgi:hypothetical protein